MTVTEDRARESADEAGARLLEGGPLPPLFGVPTAIKDLNLTKGVPTKFGSALMHEFVAPVDDHVVTLLAAAGLISLGKTNTPEFGLPCYTEPDVAPPARSPFALARFRRWLERRSRCRSLCRPRPLRPRKRRRRLHPHTCERLRRCRPEDVRAAG